MTHLLRTTCLLVLLSGCAGALKYDLRGSELSPGSDAHVVAKVDTDLNMTTLDLHASNLTPVDRVLTGGTAYLVWSRRDSSVAWNRIGALTLTDDGRTGAAQLTVAETAFDLLISAEENVGAASPSGKTVFQQRVENK